MPITPEDRVRQTIDRVLTDAGWLILLDRDGNPGFAFNILRMAYGFVEPNGTSSPPSSGPQLCRPRNPQLRRRRI